MSLPACVDGRLVSSDAALVPAHDIGLLRGHGAYEVIRVRDGVPFALDDHLERLERSADALGIPYPHADVRRDLDALLAAAPADCFVRLVLTGSGTRLALAEAPEAVRPVRLGVEAHCITPLLSGVKSLSYAAHMIALRRARSRGWDDVLLVAPSGNALEAAAASLFWVESGRVLTPPLEEGILDSITRRHVLALSQGAEAPASLSRLGEASEVFLASTRLPVAPVLAIEGVGEWPAGAVTARLREAFDELVARSCRSPRPPAG